MLSIFRTFFTTLVLILTLLPASLMAAEQEKPKCGEEGHVCVCKTALGETKTLPVVTATNTPAPAPKLVVTPPQIPGPYYPGYAAFEKTGNDLTQDLQATGTPIVLVGRVLNAKGESIPNAEIHIWQTDGLAGKYRHIADPDHAMVDPKFNSWGKTFSADNGGYAFRTIRPIAYPASDDWMRPDHIHLSVIVDGKVVLITQLYFEGDVWLADDQILQKLTPEEQAAVTIKLATQKQRWTSTENEVEMLTGTFNVVLP